MALFVRASAYGPSCCCGRLVLLPQHLRPPVLQSDALQQLEGIILWDTRHRTQKTQRTHARARANITMPYPHLVGRHKIVASLHHVGQYVRHLSLLRRHVALEVAVEREQKKAVCAHYSRDEVHHQELHLER